MGFDDERAAEISNLDPDLAKVAFSAKIKASEQQITPLAASLIERTQRGGDPATSEEIGGLSEKEARLVLRAKEVIGPETAEETKGRVGRANSFLDKIQEQAGDARNDLIAFNTMLAGVEEGDLGQFSLPAIGEALGIPGLDTPGSSAFKAGQLQLFSKLKEFFGGRLNEREFNSFLDRIPTLFQSKESKLAAIEIFKSLAEPRIEADRLVDQLEEQGVSSAKIVREVKDFKDSQADAINEKIRATIRAADPKEREKDLKSKKIIRMQNPETGDTFDILSRNVKDAQAAGWKRL